MLIYRLNKVPAIAEKVLFQVHDSGFNYKIIGLEADAVAPKEVTLFNDENSYERLANWRYLTDYTLFLRCYNTKTQVLHTLRPDINNLINIHQITHANRHDLPDYLFFHDLEIALGIFVPFHDSPPEEWVAVIPTLNNPPNIETGGEILQADFLYQVRAATAPRLKFEPAIIDNKLLSCKVGLYNSNDELIRNRQPTIYFETTAGALLVQRQTVQNGFAECLVNLEYLNQRQIKLKAGFKYYSGMAECTVDI